MQPFTRKMDNLGNLVIPSEFRRKLLGITPAQSSKVTITKLNDDTLVIQKAKEDCQSPSTVEIDNMGRVILNKELRDSMGWNTNTNLEINDDIITIKQ